MFVRCIVGNSKVVGVQRRPPGIQPALWKLVMFLSITVGTFQYSYIFRIYFFAIAWSALV
jgi:hypothetical protein